MEIQMRMKESYLESICNTQLLTRTPDKMNMFLYMAMLFGALCKNAYGMVLARRVYGLVGEQSYSKLSSSLV